MVSTWSEKIREQGLEKGREQGREQGRIEAKQNLVKALLEKRLGPLDDAILAVIESWSDDRLDEILMALYEGKSPNDLGLHNATNN